MMETPELRGITGWIVRRRWWVVAAWSVAFAALAPFAARVEQVLDVSARVDGSESAAVDSIVHDRFDSPFAKYAVLVVKGMPDFRTPEGEARLTEIVKRVNAVPGVSGTLSLVDHPDPVFRATGGKDGTMVIAGLVPRGVELETMVPRLRAVTDSAAQALRGGYPAVSLLWTGELALNYDLRKTSASDAQSAERRVLPLTLALLILAFGTLVAAFVPVVTGLAGVTAALGVAVVLAMRWPLSILLENVVTMIGLGLGIDYALLMVSRFREELASTTDSHLAAVRAVRAAGHTILLSGAAVLIGFLALLLLPLNELQAVGVGGVLVVLASVLLAVTLLPALLAILGARVNVGRVIRRKRANVDASDRWRRWGRWVTRHPVVVLLAGGAPLVMLALQARHMNTSLPRANWLPIKMESARALDELGAMGHAGIVHSLRIVVELPPGVSALEPSGWAAIARLDRELAEDPRVERVQSLPGYVREQLGAEKPSLMMLSMLPAHVLQTFVSKDQGAAIVQILPRSSVDFPALTRYVRELRSLSAQELTGIDGARFLVGGMPAFNADYENAIAGRFNFVVALVVGGTLIALLVGFRSLLIPLKALVLNLLSVAAALGAVVLVFQDGKGAALVGVGAPMGGLFPALPSLVFCIVFGLSMDYEVFLVARVAEAKRAGLSDAEGVAEGLARTAGVITSAAAIMVAVFAAFTLGDFLMIKVLGFALAAAVLFDATIVRLAIGPALLQLAGRWNWWPASVARSRMPEKTKGQVGDPAPHFTT
jgi:RND superfamily putative drug exporter